MAEQGPDISQMAGQHGSQLFQTGYFKMGVSSLMMNGVKIDGFHWDCFTPINGGMGPYL